MLYGSTDMQFIYRVSSLWLELGVSSVIVVGGCGDYFDVHDAALLVDNYVVSDATERAHSVSPSNSTTVFFLQQSLCSPLFVVALVHGPSRQTSVNRPNVLPGSWPFQLFLLRDANLLLFFFQVNACPRF